MSLVSTSPVLSSGLLDLSANQTATRLQPDYAMSQRFFKLTQDVKNGLQAGETSLSPEAKSGAPLANSLQLRLIKDVTSLEKGLDQIINMVDQTALKHKDISQRKAGIQEEAKVLFEYGNFSTNYFVATNYIQKSGESFAQEVQIFTKGR